MIDIKIIMNSSMEDVLSCRCSGLHNQNLEIHVYNKGNVAINIRNCFVFGNNCETHKYENVFPPWMQLIQPGYALAFYCSIDEHLLKKYTSITVFDEDRNDYTFSINKKFNQGVNNIEK